MKETILEYITAPKIIRSVEFDMSKLFGDTIKERCESLILEVVNFTRELRIDYDAIGPNWIYVSSPTSVIFELNGLTDEPNFEFFAEDTYLGYYKVPLQSYREDSEEYIYHVVKSAFNDSMFVGVGDMACEYVIKNPMDLT